jgi:hypothetical protein
MKRPQKFHIIEALNLFSISPGNLTEKDYKFINYLKD